jgi:hypothetical protein
MSTRISNYLQPGNKRADTMNPYATLDLLLHHDKVITLYVNEEQFHLVQELVNAAITNYKETDAMLYNDKPEWEPLEEKQVEAIPFLLTVPHIKGTLYLNPHSIVAINITPIQNTTYALEN